MSFYQKVVNQKVVIVQQVICTARTFAEILMYESLSILGVQEE